MRLDWDTKNMARFDTRRQRANEDAVEIFVESVGLNDYTRTYLAIVAAHSDYDEVCALSPPVQ